MSSIDPFVDFGEPHLVVEGLRLWVHGWEREEVEEFDDANWLRVAAHCSANGARVWTDGSILQTTDIERFGEQCSLVLSGESDQASLTPLESNLRVEISRTDRAGHLIARVALTADPLLQMHSIEFEIDQSYLPGIITGCDSTLRSFPVRGMRPRNA